MPDECEHIDTYDELGEWGEPIVICCDCDEVLD